VVADQDQIDMNGQPIGAAYLVDLFPAEIPPPPPGGESACAGRYLWAQDAGGVVADNQSVRVSISLGTLASMQVTGVQVIREPEQQPAPPAGTLVSCAGTGGPSDLPQLDVQLHRETGTYSFADATGEETEFFFEVTAAESASFDVSAVANDCDCSWYLRVFTIEDGQQHVRVVDNGGEPFRVASSSRATPVAWDPSAQAWVPTEVFPSPPGAGSDEEDGSATPPTVSQSLCASADAVVHHVAPHRFKRDPLEATFSSVPSFTEDGVGGYVSMCSWSADPPATAGTIPTIALQHFTYPSAATVASQYKALKVVMAPRWRQRGGAGGVMSVSFDRSSAIAYRGSDMIVVTAVPAGAADTGALLAALLAQPR
jgi:hypothetical protein